MVLSFDQQYLAVIIGKNLIMYEQQPDQLLIYKRTLDGFKQISKIDLPAVFNQVCMQFYFKTEEILVFAKVDQVFEFHTKTLEVNTLKWYKNKISKQPEFFLLNDDQTSMVIASQDCAFYLNLPKNQFVDIDDLYKINCIKQIIYDIEDQNFYILANKFEGNHGFYIVKFSEDDPKDYKFIMKVKNNLDIGDANIFVLRNEEQLYKELIVSYKTIHINTYMIMIIDISNPLSQI